MKNKTSLVLMEQLIMVLVFSLAAAVCLQVFARAKTISVETARRDTAVVMAQNAAEMLKATSGDCTGLKELESPGYQIQVTMEPESVPGLETAQIAVLFEDTPVFTLVTGWQEAAS